MNFKVKDIIYYIALAVFPILIGLPFTINKKNPVIIEVFLIVVGLVELIAMTSRNNKRERQNRKIYGRFRSRPEDDGYNEYKNVQKNLICSALINFAVAILWFLLFNEWFQVW